MKKNIEHSLLNSVSSLRELMTIVEWTDTTGKERTEISPLPTTKPSASNAPAGNRRQPYAPTDDILKSMGASNRPLGDLTDYLVKGKDNVNNAFMEPNLNTGRGGHSTNRGTSAKPTAPLSFAQQSQQSANDMINSPNAYSAPQMPMHQFNPSDTSYAQDHPSTDDLSGPSDLDKAMPKQSVTTPKTGRTAAKPKSTGAVSNPEVVRIQQELVDKGYPITVDGIMGPKTQMAINYDKWMQDHPEHTLNSNSAVDISEDPNDRIAEGVTFKQEDSLARIIQLARGL